MEYLNTVVNLVNQIIQNVNNNPQFADIYTSMFSLCIDNFITDLKKFAKQKVDKPPPPDVSIQNKLQELQFGLGMRNKKHSMKHSIENVKTFRQRKTR